MRDLQKKKNDRAGEFWRGIIFGYSFNSCSVTKTILCHIEVGMEKVQLNYN